MAGSGQLPGVRNAVALLHRLAASPRPLTAGALSRALSIPRSSTYLLLQVLEDEGLVRRMPEEHAYTLGLGAFEIGSAYLRHAPPSSISPVRCLRASPAEWGRRRSWGCCMATRRSTCSRRRPRVRPR